MTQQIGLWGERISVAGLLAAHDVAEAGHIG